MKGDGKLIETLNSLLADELTAINQYIVHSEMAANWGYNKLHEHFEKRALDEMKHAGKLIARILFLEGMPVVSKLNKVVIGSDVPKQLTSDHASEAEAIKSYNEAIALARKVGDNATEEMLESILQDEDRHIDKVEEFQSQIEAMGLPLFLTVQV